MYYAKGGNLLLIIFINSYSYVQVKGFQGVVIENMS